MTLTREELETIRELAKRATPGPWQTSFWIGPLEGANGLEAMVFGHGPRHPYKEEGDALAMRDSEYIAAACPQTVLSLLAEIEKLFPQESL